MAESRPADLEARIAALERDLKEMKARLLALERLMGAGGEHPTDETTVRKKVVYDWQA